MGIKAIREKVLCLELEISMRREELVAIRKKCKHPAFHVGRKAKANTGNYDPSANSYWYQCYCDICGKEWTEPQ